jgi:hypothetical protein
MNGKKPVTAPAQPALPLSNGDAARDGAPVGPGLNTLLQGQRPEELDTSFLTPPAATDTNKGRFSWGLRWTLLAADVLFVILAVWIVTRGSTRLGTCEVLLIFATLGLGAWLACCAFLLRR